MDKKRLNTDERERRADKGRLLGGGDVGWIQSGEGSGVHAGRREEDRMA